MIVKLKNHDTKQTVTLVANGLTYLRYKELTGECLGVALSELFGILASGVSIVSDMANFEKELANYDQLDKKARQELDAKIAKITSSNMQYGDVMDKLILIVASLISSSDSTARHIDDIVQDIDINWLSSESEAFAKIMECIKSLLPTKQTQKKTNKTVR